MKINSQKIFGNWVNDKSTYSPNLIKDSAKIKQIAEKKALSIFLEASKRIPAYNDFLKVNNVKTQSIKTLKDFRYIPITTKENYVERYPIGLRCWDGNITRNHMISTSSGTTGKPHFWPRDLQSEIDGAYIHEYIFRDICKVTNKKTLFINGFAMGNWIAGTFTLSCIQLITHKGYPITLMTPGYSSEAIIDTLNGISDEFESIIITGHTPFIKDLLEDCKRSNFKFKNRKVILLGTGQAVTEEWRLYITDILDSETKFFNLYGSADAALMGFETSLSISIRSIFNKDTTDLKPIFGQSRIPALYQYDPRFTFFEEFNNELIITKNSGCPLIRYNIKDNGGVYEFNEMLQKIDRKDLVSTNARFPFVYLFGRDKFMVKIYGANVYVEHIETTILKSKLSNLLTGKFKLEVKNNKNMDSELVCHLELSLNNKKSNKLATDIRSEFINGVSLLNSEYKDVLSRVGDKAKPTIILHTFGDPLYFPADKIMKTS